MLPASSRFHLQTSLPLRGCCPWGSSDRGRSKKTFKSSRLLSSLGAQAIRYSRSGEVSVEAHSGSSSPSKMVSVSPLEMAASTSGTVVEGDRGVTVTEMRTCVSHTKENWLRKSSMGLSRSLICKARSGGGVFLMAARQGERRNGGGRVDGVEEGVVVWEDVVVIWKFG
jgi:hypothetical protein